MKQKALFKHLLPNIIRSLVAGIFFLCCFQTSYGQEYKLNKLLSLYEVPGLDEIKSADDILEDKHGYIWISSANGLYKFDGYELTHYQFNPNKPNEIAGNWISGIAEDDAGNIWFGIFGIGLQKLNPVTGKFTLYKPNEADPYSLPSSKMYKILYNNGSIWLPTQKGIARLDIKTGKLKSYSTYFAPSILIINDTVWSVTDTTVGRYDPSADSIVTISGFKKPLNYATIEAYANNKLLIASEGKIYSFDIKSGLLLLHNPSEDYYLNGSIYNGKQLLIATTEGKILSFDPVTGLFEKYKINSSYSEDQVINKFALLKNGDTWITGSDKIFKLVNQEKGIENYKLFKDEKPVYNFASSLMTEWEPGFLGIGFSALLDFEREKAISAGTKYNSLDIFNNTYQFSGDYTTVFKDTNGDSWFVFLERSKHFKFSYYHFSQIDKKLTLLGSSTTNQGAVFGITKIEDDLWIATWGALIKRNIPTSTETVFRQSKDSLQLSSGELRSIFKDRDDGLWISSQTGLNYKRKNENYFTHFLHQPGNQNSISFDGISSVTQDKNGLIWIATMGGGVNSYNIQTGKFEWYNIEQGLADNNILNIVVDDNQQIWVTHELGISRINPLTKKIENFTAIDGVTPPFMEHTGVKMSDGSLIFGGIGFTRIRPDKVKINYYAPVIQLINFKLHNKEVQINGADSILHQNINVTRSIELRYNQNVISFKYASLDMAYAEHRIYAYKLEGFDTAWQYVGKRREASFTNLSPGNYTLHIKSADPNGQWQEMKAPLQITILPPWWKTWWAYCLYVILFIAAISSFIAYRSAALKKENKLLEEKVELRTTQLQTSLEDLKATQSQLIQAEKMASLGELTAGIAHEIQNPLNFVNNFSEVSLELIEEIKSEKSKPKNEQDEKLEAEILHDIAQNLEKINHHGKRADAIVKGMLQHSRSSSGQKEPTDINSLCDEYLRLSYHGLRAKDKSFNATLKTDFDNSIVKINIIPQDIGRVIMNLLTNAFYAVNERSKLTIQNSQGITIYEPTVSMSSKKIDNNVEIKIMDNGNGIPDPIKEKIFQPFFTTKPTGQGTGLGLSLSYDIIKTHQGDIQISSEEGAFTAFTIRLPLS